jgi:hypothetical protein
MSQTPPLNVEGSRDAILRLSVVNLAFTHFVAAVLNEDGYAAECGVRVPGACAVHDLDVVAEQAGKIFAIKTVFVPTHEQQVTLQTVLAAYATYLDLLDGADVQACPHFAEYWLVTNGIFSQDAVAYASHKGLRLIDGDELVSMLTAMTYPVTAISGLTDVEFAALAEANVLLTRHLTDHEVELMAHRTGLPQSRIAELIDGIQRL